MPTTKNQKIAAAYYAAKEELTDSDIREFLAYYMNVPNPLIDEILALLAKLNAPMLQRALSRSIQLSPHVRTSEPIELNEIGFYCRQGEIIGRHLILHKPIQPHEMQAKVAYEVFYAKVFDIFSRKYQIVVLNETEHMVELFVPTQYSYDFDILWSELVQELFSLEELKNTFILLMKSIKLTNRGFSAIQAPIFTRDQAEVLAGFDLINLRSLMSGDERRRREIRTLANELTVPSIDVKDRTRLQKRLTDTKKQLADRLDRYEPLYEQWNEIVSNMRDWAIAVEKAERLYKSSAEQPTAGQQIAKSGAKVGKAVQQIANLGELVIQEQFVKLDPLLSPNPVIAPVRSGGDNDTKICYGCGRALMSKEQTYKANTFIFTAPSQRLQSGGSQKEPNVCRTCAAVSFISPIKLGEGRLVLRLHSRADPGLGEYMPDTQLRMFALGDLNIVAGRYAMLMANESIGSDLLIDKLGGIQYAIYKIATIFSSPTVFQEYEPEVLIGDNVVRLAPKHMIWMQQLVEIFMLNRRWIDKSHFNALGRAIRYVQQDKLVHAIYELLRTNMIPVQQIDFLKSIRMEDLRASHWEELNKMSDSTKAKFYQDVAAVTGLHYAFCRYIYSKTSGNDRRIAVRKAIERSDNPYQFNYTEAAETKSDDTILRRDASNYFIYAQAVRLLSELDVDLEQRRSFTDQQRELLKLENQEAIQLYIDDIINAHTYLVENRYFTPKAQREFFYALKLSLHSRFPDLLERHKENE